MKKKIEFKKVDFSSCEEYFKEYVQSLTGIYDNYVEDHILDSDFYHIWINQNIKGYFAVCKKDGCNMITQFYMRKEDYGSEQEVFEKVLKELSIENAYVPTCDAHFLSLCIENHEKIEVQSYSFEESGAEVLPPAYARENFKLVSKDRWEEINEKTEYFFDECLMDKVTKEKILYEIYELKEGSEVLGYGLREGCRIFTAYEATGMYVMPRYRNKGVGRSIILHLKDICREHGKTPLPGCWYYNYGSKATLESSGYVPSTRLLKISFK